jgi:biotin carboxyl carrier protein
MKLKITVHGVAYEVDVEVLDPGEGFAPASALPPMGPPAGAAPSAGPRPVGPPPRPRRGPVGDAGASVVGSPIAGTVVEIKCKEGDAVEEGAALLVVEAMKMNTTISAPRAGTIKAVPVAAGDAVREGQTLVEFE